MADQKVAPTPVPAPPQPAPAAPVAVPSSPKGGSGKVIIIIVATIVITLGLVIGGFFGYKALVNNVKKEVTPKTSNSTSATSEKPTETSTSGGTDKYSTTKDIQPSTDLGKQVDSDVRAVLKSVFGGVKLESSFSITPGVGNLVYVPKRAVTASDGATIESGLVAKGYTRVAPIISTNDGFVVDVRKSYEVDVVANLASDTSTITVSVMQ